MEEVANSANIVEILLNDMLKDKEVQEKQIINGQVRGQIVVDNKFVIDVQEN